MVAQEKTTQNDHQQQRDEEYYSPSFIEAEGEDQEYEDFDLRPQHFARRRQCRVTTTVLGILVLAGIGTGTYFALSRNSAVAVRMVEAPQTAAPATTNSTAVSDGTSSSSSTNSTASDGITLEQVGVHNTADDCWHAIQGTVYDLTSYAPGKQKQ